MHVQALRLRARRRSCAVAAVLAVVLASLVRTAGALAWTWPAEGSVLRPFSVGPDPYAGGQHRGVDIGAALGTVVVAPAAGTVSFVGFVPGGGRAVTITTGDGYAVTLLQLGASSVEQGGTVTEGAEVGVVGESSDPVTLQPHVHLGVRTAADPDGYVDPLGLLPSRPAAPPPPPPPPVSEPPVAVPALPGAGEIPSPQPTPAEPVAVESVEQTPVASPARAALRSNRPARARPSAHTRQVTERHPRPTRPSASLPHQQAAATVRLGRTPAADRARR